MKELNEYTAEIFCRAEKGIKKRKARRNSILMGVIPACACLVIVLSVGVRRGDFWDNQPTAVGDNSTAEGSITSETNSQEQVDDVTKKDMSDLEVDSSTQSSDEPTKQVASVDGNTDTVSSTSESSSVASSSIGVADERIKYNFTDSTFALKANKIIGAATAARRYFDSELYTEKALTEREAADYLGIDLSLLNLGGAYSGFSAKNTVTDSFGQIAYDTFCAHYGDNVTVLASKIGTPYDCLYELESTESSVFYCNDKVTPQATAVIGTDGNDFFYADFSTGGINYRVTAQNSNIVSFGYIVKSVIDLSVK